MRKARVAAWRRPRPGRWASKGESCPRLATGLWADDASVLSEARIQDGVRAVTMPWRAFDNTVSRKPLGFAVDAVYGNSIDLGLEVIARKGLARKPWLLMVVNVLLLAFTPMIVTPRLFFFQAKTLAPIHAAASAA